jgi:hypothetical protein
LEQPVLELVVAVMVVDAAVAVVVAVEASHALVSTGTAINSVSMISKDQRQALNPNGFLITLLQFLIQTFAGNRGDAPACNSLTPR